MERDQNIQSKRTVSNGLASLLIKTCIDLYESGPVRIGSTPQELHAEQYPNPLFSEPETPAELFPWFAAVHRYIKKNRIDLDKVKCGKFIYDLFWKNMQYPCHPDFVGPRTTLEKYDYN